MNKIQKLKALYKKLTEATTQDTSDAVLVEFRTFCDGFSEAEKSEYAVEIAKIACARIDAAVEDARLEHARLVIEYKGNSYRFPEWLTIASYAKIHGEALQTVFNWIKREKIKSEDIVEIEDLNNLKLIRNKKYELRKYQLNAS